MLASWFPSFPTSALRGVVSIGNFDGVHKGHAFLISRIKRLALEMDAPAVAVTFDPPPIKLLAPNNVPPSLTTIPRRIELLKSAGVDHVLVLQTNAELLSLDANSFFEQLLLNGLNARGLVEGPNFRFGKQRGGDVSLLKELCKKHDMAFEVVEPKLIDSEWISSTRIRQLIDTGDLSFANTMLTSPYRIAGVVSPGVQRGRTIGFPTANLDKIPVQIPAVGVYAAKLVGLDGLDDLNSSSAPIGNPVALHIGPNPTFGEDARKVEAHILHFDGDIYGRVLELEVLDRIRTVRKFESLEALRNQLNQDITQVDSIVRQGNRT